MAIREVVKEADDEGANAGDDRERFEQLYRRYASEVLAYTLRRAPPEAAQDAVADTFLVAWRRLDAVPQRPLPWLLGVARRTLATQRRSQHRRTALVDKLRREPTEHQSTQAADESRVLAALERLPEREALMLTAWEELNSSEAASVLSCSPIAFRLRLHRARRRLARELEAEQEGARLRRIELPVRELN